VSAGIRPAVWVALAASSGALAAAIAFTIGSTGAGEPARIPSAVVQPSRSVNAVVTVPPSGASAARRPQAAQVGDADAGAVPAVGAGPALAPASDPPVDRRSSELVGLERDAADLASGSGLVDVDALDAQLASAPRRPGEGDAEWERRIEVERERILSEEVLVQRRLVELFEGTVYPLGFPVEQVVAAQERQWIRDLPGEDRAILLRQALEDEREPARAEPRYEGFAPPAEEPAPDL